MFPLGSSLMFDRYFPLIKAFHVDWFSIRHQSLSIPAYTEADSMVSPTRVMFPLCLLCDNTSWISSVMGSICKTYCGEIWKNMSTGYGRSYHS